MPRVPTNIDGLAAIVGTHADKLADHGEQLDKLDERADVVDLQLAVWKGQLRTLAAIAGVVGGIVGALAGALAGPVLEQLAADEVVGQVEVEQLEDTARRDLEQLREPPL